MMVLDPFLIAAARDVKEEALAVSLANLYPVLLPLTEEDFAYIKKWKAKLLQNPGLSLSTGRTNSLKGMLTCSLMDCLGVPLPRAARSRIFVAWAILNSPGGIEATRGNLELDAARTKWMAEQNPITSTARTEYGPI